MPFAFLNNIKKRKSQGFTFAEIIIASFVALLLMGIVFTIFFYGKRIYDYSSYSYSISEKAYAPIIWLKYELMETSLNTIKVYPDEKNKKEPPGVSFESAHNPGTGRFEFSKFGAPKWSKHVFYTLVPAGEKQLGNHKLKTSDLIRWELKLQGENPIPFSSEILPSSEMQKIPEANRRLILKNVIPPLQYLGDKKKIDEYGGFDVFFVRKDTKKGEGIESKINPSEITDENTRGTSGTITNTELIKVEITVLEFSSTTGKPNAFNITFMVKPKN
ncbi:MAG: hypothetical protein K8T10_03000 [Candidatus Eremiobacteraeota bacterium]|nr:hypothetical protein [Candidatus Eremiobacteraeota bacterium]